MKRAFALVLTMVAAVLVATRVLRSAPSEPLPDFGGTWRLATQSLKPTVHPGSHNHPLIDPRLPPIALVVTQWAESITVQFQTLDSTGRAIAAPRQLTYLMAGEWSGLSESPPGGTIHTRMKARPHDYSLELESVTTWREADGRGEDRITTTETWRLAADGMLNRRVHDVSRDATFDLNEMWHRVANDKEAR